MLATLIANYGYLAIFVGTFFEGETILILGGFAAHRGYLYLPFVILLSFLGATAGDQFYYFLGRHHKLPWFLKKPSWQPQIDKIQQWLHKIKIPLIIGFRFFYGFRTLTPFVIGMSGIRPRIFIPLNILGALLWSTTFGVLGYLFGTVLEKLFKNIRHYEREVFFGILILSLAVGVTFSLVKRWRAHHH